MNKLQQIRKWAVEALGFEYDEHLVLDEYSGELGEFDELLTQLRNEDKRKIFDRLAELSKVYETMDTRSALETLKKELK